MIYARAALALLGALLVVFCGIRISWQFISWGVLTISKQSPAFMGTDPRIRYRVEAIALAVGLTLFLVAWKL